MDGEYEIVPGEAEVVKRIFSLYLGGSSMWEICKVISEEGHKTARGGQWRPNNISNILHNPTYAGTAHHQRYTHKKTRNASTGEFRHKVVERSRDEWIPIPAPPVVSQEEFARVQLLFAENQKKRSGRPDRIYPLTGMMRCSECRRSYCGSYHKRSELCYYRSHDQLHPNETFSCKWKNMIRAEHAEEGVLKLISEVAMNPEVVHGALMSYWREEEHKGRAGGERQRVVEELAKTERQLRSILEKEIEEPEMGQIYADMKLEKKAHRQTLIERLNSLPE